MKIYADIEQAVQQSNPRVVYPIVSQFPATPVIGEVVYFNKKPREGLYLYDGTGWIGLFSYENNIWEEQIAIENEQSIFTFQNSYSTDGKSIVVYLNGHRLKRNEYAEVSNNEIFIKDAENIKEGDSIEIQIFNKKLHAIFGIKAFNRRNGIV